MISLAARLRARWMPVDWIVAGYTAWMGLLIAAYASHVPQWPQLVTVHAGIIATLLIIPPRGARWEMAPALPLMRHPHAFLRFLRHVYPLPLALFFFEEGSYTVNMIFSETPYWFEPYLFAADAAIFGDLPARLLNGWVTPWLTELVSFFYWSYYSILIGGLTLAYVGCPRAGGGGRRPAPAFERTITSLAAAFILSFLFYPWLAARGPWETPALMAELAPLHGGPFTWIMDRIIEHGAVSGNCFPSAHVAGAWAIVLALAARRRHRAAAWIGAVLAAGMTVACVYTRYHHFVDVVAGLGCGVLGALLGGWLEGRGRSR